MSVYNIKNRFLDPFDPFWICRILSLKIGTVTILLCLCNTFLKSTQAPMVYMLTVIICTAATEVLPLNSKIKKLSVFFLVLFLLSTSGMLFGLFSYFRVGLFVFIMVFSYLALRFMATNPKAAVIPSLMIIWGVMQLEGGGSTDLNAVANSYLYFVEFGLMGVITILFFPDFTPNIFKSALIRILESDIRGIGDKNFKNSHASILSALYVIHSKLPFLPPKYDALYQAVIRFQHDFIKSSDSTAEMQAMAKSVLSELIDAIDRDKTFSLTSECSKKIKDLNFTAHQSISNLVDGYNLCKA